MEHHRKFQHTQVGFVAVLTEPVHIETGMEYVKNIFQENKNLTAIPVEGDSGVIGIVEKKTLLKEHGVLDNLLHGKLRHFLNENVSIVDAREHVERTLPLLLGSSPEIIEHSMVFHLGKFYGILNTHTLLNHIFALRNDSLERAKTIQTHLTGTSTYTHGCFHAAVHVEQAHALGGDFFQMCRLSDCVSIVSCFDVSGKDIQASLLTGLISGYFSAIETSPKVLGFGEEEIVHNLHQIIRNRTPDDIFVAGIMIFYNSESRTINMYNMGYSPVYIITREENRRKIRVKNPPLPPLGFPSLTLDRDSVLTVRQGDNLILFGYSDGLTDAHDQHGNEYGEERVTQMVQKVLGEKSTDIADRLLENVMSFIGTSPRTDDITVFQIECLEEGA
ncbi:MAG: PP2C family protein-serine/threonine phosphatase [Spirochaetota bacterium]